MQISNSCWLMILTHHPFVGPSIWEPTHVDFKKIITKGKKPGYVVILTPTDKNSPPINNFGLRGLDGYILDTSNASEFSPIFFNGNKCRELDFSNWAIKKGASVPLLESTYSTGTVPCFDGSNRSCWDGCGCLSLWELQVEFLVVYFAVLSSY